MFGTEIHISSLPRQFPIPFYLSECEPIQIRIPIWGKRISRMYPSQMWLYRPSSRSRFDSTVERLDCPSSRALPDIQAVDAKERSWEKADSKLRGRSFQSSISLEIRSYLCFVYMSLSHTLSLYKLKHSFFTLSFPTGEDLRVFSSSYLVATSLFVLRVCFLKSKRVPVYNCVSSVSFTGSGDGSVPYYMPGPIAFVLLGSPPIFGLWI